MACYNTVIYYGCSTVLIKRTQFFNITETRPKSLRAPPAVVVAAEAVSGPGLAAVAASPCGSTASSPLSAPPLGMVRGKERGNRERGKGEGGGEGGGEGDKI